MCKWLLRTENAVSRGARYEVFKQVRVTLTTQQHNNCFCNHHYNSEVYSALCLSYIAIVSYNMMFFSQFLLFSHTNTHNPVLL